MSASGAKHTKEIVDLTGANKLAPLEDRTIANPVGRIPEVIFVDRKSGNEALSIPEGNITADEIRVINPSATQDNESVLLVWKWHSRTR